MGNKIWGTISILVGAFGLFLSYRLYHQAARDGKPWLLLLAGLVLIVLGIWRVRRKPLDPTAEFLK